MRASVCRLGGVPYISRRAAAQGRCAARRDRRCAARKYGRSPKADRAVAELRGTGGHRDGERAADHRDARSAGAADRDRRGVAGHQFLARRSCSRCSTRCSKRRCACAMLLSAILITYDGERFRTVAVRGVPPELMRPYAANRRRPVARELGRPHCCEARAYCVRRTTCWWPTNTELGTRRTGACAISVRARTLSSLLRSQGRTLLGAITIYRQRGAAVLGEADRAVAKLRRAGGYRDGERAAAGRNPPAPGRIARHLRQHGRRRRDVRRRTCGWPPGTAISSNSRPARRRS